MRKSLPAQVFATFTLWAIVQVLFCLSGCTQTQPEKPNEPEKQHESPNRTEPLQIDYHAFLSLKQEDSQMYLSSQISLNITAKQSLSRIDLWPGLGHLKIADHLALDQWQWDLYSIYGNRPMSLSAQPWSLVLQSQQPVEKGDLWHIEMEYRRPITQVDAACSGSSPVLQTLLGLQNRDPFSNMVGEDDFYVLQPRLPLVYDCNGKDPSQTFAPTTCIARHDLPAEIHIELPAGWQAALPSRVTWEKGKNQTSLAQLTRIPAVVAIAPSLVFQKLSIGGKEVQLCAPSKLSKGLTPLATLVERLFPILETMLGPYPEERPTICLSPFPVSSHSRGSLSFVSRLHTKSGQSLKSTKPKQTKPQQWWDSPDHSQLLEEDELIRAMAHQWWRIELPQRYQELFRQGLNAYASRTILHELNQDKPDQLSFLDTLPWLGVDQTRAQKYIFTSTKRFLNHQEVMTHPFDLLNSELHGLLTFSKLFSDKAHQSQLRSLLSQPERVCYDPNQLLESFDQLSRGLESIVQSDQHIKLTEGPKIRQYKTELRSSLRRIVPAHQLRTCLPTLLEQNTGSNKPNDPQPVWAPISEVARLRGFDGCRDRPTKPKAEQKCLQMFAQNGPNVLADIMNRSQSKAFLHHLTTPKKSVADEQTQPDASRLAQIYEQADLLSQSPIRVQDRDAQHLRKALPISQAYAALLYARIRARWAARIFLTHWPEAKRNLTTQRVSEPFIEACEVGYVRPNSPADLSGFRFRDAVREIDGRKISAWNQVEAAIQKSAGQPLHCVVQRGHKLVHVRITPQKVHDHFRQKTTYDVGFKHRLVGNLVGVIADSPAYKAGLRQADRIVEINTQAVLIWEQIREILENNGTKPLTLKIARSQTKSARSNKQTFLELQLIPSSKKHAPAHAFCTKSAYFGFEPLQLYLEGTKPGKAAEQAGLQLADKIIMVNSTKVFTWSQFSQVCHSLNEDLLRAGLRLTVRRGKAQKTIVLHPNIATKQHQGRESKRLSFGLFYKPNWKKGQKQEQAK